MCSRMGGSHLHYRHEATKFPCIFAGNREMRGGDGFADDCLHRQLVPYFYREMPPSEIVTTVPRVSPAKVDVNGRRERSLENGAALWVANSPLGSSAVRLGAAEITTHHRELVRVYVMRRSLVDVCLVPLADVEHLATPLVAIVHRDTRPSARAA